MERVLTLSNIWRESASRGTCEACGGPGAADGGSADGIRDVPCAGGGERPQPAAYTATTK